MNRGEPQRFCAGASPARGLERLGQHFCSPSVAQVEGIIAGNSRNVALKSFGFFGFFLRFKNDLDGNQLAYRLKLIGWNASAPDEMQEKRNIVATPRCPMTILPPGLPPGRVPIGLDLAYDSCAPTRRWARRAGTCHETRR